MVTTKTRRLLDEALAALANNERRIAALESQQPSRPTPPATAPLNLCLADMENVLACASGIASVDKLDPNGSARRRLRKIARAVIVHVDNVAYAQMAMKAIVEPNPRKLSPLFPTTFAGRTLFADEIAKVRISRQAMDPMTGKRRRIRHAAMAEVSGMIDPFTTTEQDIANLIGGGEYYIEPIGHNGKLLPGGRALILPRTSPEKPLAQSPNAVSVRRILPRDKIAEWRLCQCEQCTEVPERTRYSVRVDGKRVAEVFRNSVIGWVWHWAYQAPPQDPHELSRLVDEIAVAMRCTPEQRKARGLKW